MLRFLPFIVLLALIVYALVDCVRHDDSEMPVGLPKAVWVVLIIVFPAAGAIAWLVVSRVGQSRARQSTPGGTGHSPHGPASYGRGPRPGQRPPRQVAPDDDPDFLASLDHPRRPAAGEQPVADAGTAGRDATGADAGRPDTPSDDGETPGGTGGTEEPRTGRDGPSSAAGDDDEAGPDSQR